MTRDELIIEQEKEILRDFEETERLMMKNLGNLSYPCCKKYVEYVLKDYQDSYQIRAAMAVVKGVCIPIIKPYYSCPEKIVHHFFIRFICSRKSKNVPYPNSKDFLDYYFDSRP